MLFNINIFALYQALQNSQVYSELSFLFDPVFTQLSKSCWFQFSGFLNISQVSHKDFYLASNQSLSLHRRLVFFFHLHRNLTVIKFCLSYLFVYVGY